MTSRIVVAAVFLVGCAVGGVSSQLVVPKANAQQATLTKWEYLCPRNTVPYDDWQAFANKAGGEGWELATQQTSVGTVIACFKRPRM